MFDVVAIIHVLAKVALFKQSRFCRYPNESGDEHSHIINEADSTMCYTPYIASRTSQTEFLVSPITQMVR